MAIDAIIFDLDGTLVDTVGLHATAWRLALERAGYGVGEDRLVREIGKAGAFFVPAVLGERIEADEGDALREAHDSLYLDLVASREVRSFSCAERLLRAASERGFKTAISTGSARDGVERVIDATGLKVTDLVDVAITDADVTSGKPGPEPVFAAAERLGVAPSQCVLVGDTPFDVECARRAGAVTIGVATGAYTQEELLASGARVVYADVAELGERLDEAVRICSPGSIHLTREVLDGLMGEALGEAKIALDGGNLPVGAVVADGAGKVVARAHSRTETSGNFLDHAEMRAFGKLPGKVDFTRRELILATTLEPCVMCYGAAMGARVETILYGLDGPSNGGVDRCLPMRSPGMIPPRVVAGIRIDECRALFEAWRRKHPETPFVQDLLMRV
jgi:phosphoglycolate phosphatase-like HAD superfamily hydrolase/tRNA(Arg) A34 adenosine deaminase TadA